MKPAPDMENLRLRLEEAEETLAAIRRGEVDGLVVSGPQGEQVFTLEGANRSYRFFVEAMNEGALTLALDGTILYCNDCFANMVNTPGPQVVGNSIYRFLASSKALFQAAFEKGTRKRSKLAARLRAKGRRQFPVSLALNPIRQDELSGVCLVVTDLTEHLRKDRLIEKSGERLRDLSARLIMAYEQERKRISYEIHDALGSALGRIRFMADKLQERIGPDEILQDMIAAIRETGEEMRRIQTALHPPLLDDLGLLATINWMIREFEKTYSGIRVEKQVSIDEKGLPATLKMALYRIIQEAFHNIAKHSQADFIDLSLLKENGLTLQIRDNGRGFKMIAGDGPDVSGKGIGLSSMRERIELTGGSLTIRTSPGKGASIRAHWPPA